MLLQIHRRSADLSLTSLDVVDDPVTQIQVLPIFRDSTQILDLALISHAVRVILL